MTEEKYEKLTVKQSRGAIRCSYDRFKFSSLLGILLSLVILGSLFIDLISFDLSFRVLLEIAGLLIPGYIFYSLVRYSLNHTNIFIDAWYITVYDLPIPFYGRIVIRKGNVKFVQTATEDFYGMRSAEDTYSVIVVLNDNERVTLIRNVSDFSDAKMIERIVRDSLDTPQSSV